MKKTEKKQKTFNCDFCGKDKPIKEKFKVYDENWNLQRGIYKCAKCGGL
jgi:transcription elongation factor Elf1